MSKVRYRKFDGKRFEESFRFATQEEARRIAKIRKEREGWKIRITYEPGYNAAAPWQLWFRRK